ncbi:NAD-dependent epimerase/dehydratase family protein [Mucilaginibacter sp. JRF]|uniref:NAD-dependent epimerase/dehydratase family protein n=1 Tax=Mucilaginibacter sp. JRF TaxID=2780088 RepID=UPI00187F6B3E|nr:NAD-dependent epimerase/dehydratase family protein [Mucilaginibacter sp. JRF]MBE9584781.1 NAD-dependent epimerase/dehydratase family protein [Mucilaginibacter sp. JRF]
MILITGATGFLGAEVALQLVKQGERVRCIKRASSVIPEILKPHAALIEWFDADMLDVFALEDAFAGVTQVYHAAAWVSLKQKEKNPMIAANVAGTANIVNLCLDNNCKLVHVSSIAALGLAKPGEVITENTHLDVSTETDGYAISKLESEMEVWRGIAEGLDAVIVNPSLIIGVNAGDEGTGQIFNTVRKGLKFYTSGTAGLVDVQDVAKSMIALMNSDITAERFIINSENLAYKQLVEEIAQGYGIPVPAKEAKPWVMNLAWRAAAFIAAITGKDPFLDKIAAQSAVTTKYFDNSKIKKAIGIEFKPVSESIREICAL